MRSCSYAVPRTKLPRRPFLHIYINRERARERESEAGTKSPTTPTPLQPTATRKIELAVPEVGSRALGSVPWRKVSSWRDRRWIDRPGCSLVGFVFLDRANQLGWVSRSASHWFLLLAILRIARGRDHSGGFLCFFVLGVGKFGYCRGASSGWWMRFPFWLVDLRSSSILIVDSIGFLMTSDGPVRELELETGFVFWGVSV